MVASFDLSSARLYLVPVRASHITSLAQGRRELSWAADFPQPTDVDAARHLLEAGLLHDGGAAFGVWFIVEQDNGEVIGTVGFDGPPQDGVVGVAYGIVPSRRRNGFAVEALQCITQYALSQPGVLRVEAHAQSEESAGVLIKAGYEGANSPTNSVFRYDGVAFDAADESSPPKLA